MMEDRVLKKEEGLTKRRCFLAVSELEVFIESRLPSLDGDRSIPQFLELYVMPHDGYLSSNSNVTRESSGNMIATWVLHLCTGQQQVLTWNQSSTRRTR